MFLDKRSRQATLIRMGFPIREDKERFICPQCKVRVPALPTTCPICRLPLVSGKKASFHFSNLILAPHLARSYHHLFPPPPTEAYYSDDEENEKESENEKSERNRKEKEIFDTIKPCVGCLEVPSSIEEARQFVYCTKCNCPLCQESGLLFRFLI